MQTIFKFVHDIDLSFLNKNKSLEEEIKKLNGKKIIFTNGSRAHALNVTKELELMAFDGIFDIRIVNLFQSQLKNLIKN